MCDKAGVTDVESIPLDESALDKGSGNEDMVKINSIIDKYDGEKRSLLSILLDIQSECNYLPKYALAHVARKLALPFSRVYSTATFYKAFSLEPRGKHIVTVCVGTACHVRGGPKIMDYLSRSLNIGPGETTENMQFTLETVNCLGCCAIGPIVVVDGEYNGGMTISKTDSLLAKYRT